MSRNSVEQDSVKNKNSFGIYGINRITSAGALIAITSDDRFSVIEAVEDSVIDFTNDVAKGVLSGSSWAIPKGGRIYGYFHGISVTSGAVVAYYTE
tara:strand:- start:128 stop:415 length:288 start_codon:yes stop_codon:yes gene_type:complete